MPKLSVYVPDDLWEQAKHAAPGSKSKPNNSQIVQRALEQMLSERQALRSAFSAGAVRDEARLTGIVRRLRDAANQEYEQGYSAGLELGEVIDFWDLRVLMNAGGLSDFDGIAYVSRFTIEAEDEPVAEWWRKYDGAFSDADDDADDDASIPDWTSPNEPFRAGASQAIEDVWQALRANSWGTVQVAITGDEGDGTEDSDETDEQ